MEPPSLLCSFISDITKYLFLNLLLLSLLLLPPMSARVCSQRVSMARISLARLASTSSFYSYSQKSQWQQFSQGSVGGLGEDCLVNSKEMEADTSIFSFYFSLYFSLLASCERERVQFRKLSLSTACGFFFKVWVSRSSRLMVFAIPAGSLLVAEYQDWMVPSNGSSKGGGGLSICCGLELIIMLLMVQLRLLQLFKLWLGVFKGFDYTICDSTKSIEDQLSSAGLLRLVFIEKSLDLMVKSEKLEELFFIFDGLLSSLFTLEGESSSFSFLFSLKLPFLCSYSKAALTARSTSFIFAFISLQQSSSCRRSTLLFFSAHIFSLTQISILRICSSTDLACRCRSDSEREGMLMLLGYS